MTDKKTIVCSGILYNLKTFCYVVDDDDGFEFYCSLRVRKKERVRQQKLTMAIN